MKITHRNGKPVEDVIELKRQLWIEKLKVRRLEVKIIQKNQTIECLDNRLNAWEKATGRLEP